MQSEETRNALLVISCIALAIGFLICRAVVTSKLGKVLVAIRDARLKVPAAGVCLSPWVDLEGVGDSMTTKATVDPMVQKAGLVEMGKLYLGGKNARTPLAAPLYADLSGLPPLPVRRSSGFR